MSVEAVQLSEAKRALLQKYLQGRAPRASTASQAIPKRASTGPAPLSYGQQQLWLLAQMAPETPFYNECVTVHLPGPLDAAILERSFNAILQRHEMWRTTFDVVDGQPVQIVRSVDWVSLPVIDLQHLPAGERESEALRIATEDAWRPFDLVRGPLLRARLVCLSEEDHRLFLTLHHIIFDGVSIYNVLLPELAALYEAFAAGAPSPLLELPIQYADYAQWQREWLQGDFLTTQLAYWRKQLAGDLPVLQLPTDRPRPAQQTYRGALQRVAIPKRLLEALKGVSRREGVTLFMTLLAAFNVLLYRYTGQEDMLIGSVTAGRHRSEIEKLLGFFLNTLVLRTDVSGNPSFRALLARVRDVTLAAVAHAHVPFELVVKDLQPERDVSRNPLFQVMFTLEPPLPPLANHWSLSQLDVDTRTAKFDLSLELDERQEGIIGRFEYNTDLFDDATITRMLGHFYVLLEHIVADPGRRITDLPLLTPAERQQLLVTWNATAAEYPRELCLHHLIKAQAERTPDAVAVVDERTALTYRQLNERANQLAWYLRRLGVQPETCVGVSVERSAEMIVGLLGVLKAGGAYVPLDPSYPQERLAFMIADAELPVLVTQRQFARSLPAHNARLVCLDSDWPAIATERVDAPLSEAATHNLAYVIYTSGSTGQPKGVQIPHCAVVNFLLTMQERPGMSAADTLLAVTTLSFDIAALEIFLPLTVGARVVVASPEATSDGAALAWMLDKHRVTIMQATPATWRMLVDVDWRGGPHFRILCGGEALPQDLAEQLLTRCAQLWNLYGPTETTIWSTLHRVECVAGPVPIGRPIGNTQLYILDKRLQPAPIGVAGELYIGGAGVARGYRRRPELTAEKFLPNPFGGQPGARLYRTGDLARYLPDGAVEFLGRADFQVKVRGFRIELEEIEAALRQHPAVREAVVMVREDTPGDKCLTAYLLPARTPAPSVAELRSFLHTKLPAYMTPSTYVTLSAFPLTPNGKVNRRALPRPEHASLEASRPLVAPRTALERQLLDIWQALFGAQSISVTDNFFELGGHSLLAVRLLTQIRKRCGKRLPFAALFQAQTIEQLAQLLEQEDRLASWSSLAPIQPYGSRPPFFCVHGHDGQVLAFRSLAAYLGQDQPFYGLQSQGLDGQRPFMSRLEDIAAHYLKEIWRIQPAGPYYLGGFCLGGKIAFEMAQQLHAQGQRVALLALIDTYGVGFPKPAPWRQRIVNVRRNLRGLTFSEKWRYLRARAEDLYGHSKRYGRTALVHACQRLGWPTPRRLRGVSDANFQAVAAYQLRRYPGRIALFRPSQLASGYDHDPLGGWGQMAAGGVEVHVVPGSHDMMHEPQVRLLAEQLRTALQEARLPSRTPARLTGGENEGDAPESLSALQEPLQRSAV